MPQKLINRSGLGTHLKNLRLESGFGVTELATYMQLSGCDITRECLVKIEAETHNVSMEQLYALKKALNVSYDKIFEFLEEDK
ncbi:MAG: helix-turn-helix transcriptional regulator [Clostridia bacterium]|nr:helix-turn-helix transcriptional regulator [Clostridia bacterium]